MAITPFRLNFYLFFKLPAAWFMGVRLLSVNREKGVVRLPYSWFSQNPFKSIYFAAQCGAAELSTGVLALTAIEGRPKVSMLIVKIEGEFFKKANKTLLFTCEDGAAIHQVIEAVIQENTPKTFTATSTGRLPDGTIAAVIKFTWSFKLK
jgi:Domain of unknown function (DUF4442)